MNKSTILRVACVQQAYANDYEKNLAHTIEGIRQAKTQGTQLVVLRELFAGPYFCQTEHADIFNLAESIPGPTSQALCDIARELNLVIVTSIFEKRAPGLYHNTGIAIDTNGEIAGRYRKMHIPDDPGYYEKFYFTPGDLGFKPITTSVGKLGLLVCWDQWYPEAARLMALAGADLLLYPTAIGWGTQEHDDAEKKRQLEAWITVQRGHAVANGLPVVVTNRIGFEAATPGAKQGINFWGNSFIAGPQGEFLARAAQDQAEILIADIDLNRCEQVRRGWPFLRDRRIDDYGEILKRFID